MIAMLSHSSEERLFEPFFDKVDTTVLIPATQPLNEIVRLTEDAPLRFPLQLDGASSLLDHLRSSDYAPASGRFGAFCDNVLGMNWQLPDGRCVRIGERVVKSTTGYDWFRFLLHTEGRFGRPTDYIIRLRPDCTFWLLASFEGTTSSLRAATTILLRGGWMHWWDSVDILSDSLSKSCRVAVNCPAEEAHLFKTELARVASISQTALSLRTAIKRPDDGLPDLAVKTTPDRAATIADALVAHGFRTVTLSYCGVIHGYTANPSSIPASIAPFEKELFAQGGHWMSRHHPTLTCYPDEIPWLRSLANHLNLHS